MTHEQAVSSLATERYALDEMPELERYAFEEHYFACAECAADVREAGIMREGVRHGLAGTGRDAIPSPSAGMTSPTRMTARAGAAGPAGWRVALPWAVAASLALVVGYQSLIFAPAPQPFTVPQSLNAVTLRPASRGAAPVIAIGEDETVVTLAVEVGAPPDATLFYELHSEERGRIFGGVASVQLPGAPLLLLVPAAALTPPGRYEVQVRAREGDAEPSVYRFSTAAR